MANSLLPDMVVATEFLNFDSKNSAFSTLGSNYDVFSLSEAVFWFFGRLNNYTKMMVTELPTETTTSTGLAYTCATLSYESSVFRDGGPKSTFEYTTL